MRLALALALLGYAACASTPCPQPAAEQADLAFTRVNVIDVESGRVLPSHTVLIAGNRIRAVGPSAKVRVPAGARVVDGSGKYLIPGLWDMHGHSLHPANLPLFVANGVTGVRVMRGVPRQLQWRTEIQRGERLGPLLYLSGPVIDRARPSGATAPSEMEEGTVRVRTPEETAAQVRAQKDAGYDFIKIRNSLSPLLYAALLAEARNQAMPVAGHVPPTVALTEALGARQATIEHLTGYLQALVPADAPQQPGADYRSRVLAWRFADSTRMVPLAQATFAAGVWNTPTLAARIHDVPQAEFERYLARPEAAYLSPAIRELYRSLRVTENLTEEDFHLAVAGHAKQDAVVRALRIAGAGLLAGTDVGPWGFSLHWELEALVNAGLTPAEALRAATWNPGRFLSASDSLGSVQPGKRADLVLLDADPLADIRNTQKIRVVVLNGRYLNRNTLDELLATAERAASGR